MRGVVNVLFAAWLVVGLMAAGQRHYIGPGALATCDAVGTVAANVAAGPLNYHGIDPQVSCPQPS